MERRIVPLSRSVAARLVPTGDPTTLPAGAFVTLTQTLGGNYTVILDGNMARIDGADGDALGMQAEQLTFSPPADGRVDPSQVDTALRSVYDPEIPVNIVDLGLIYGREISPEGQVSITMTLTAPGCGMGPVLVQEVKDRVRLAPFVTDVHVELVFDPPWSREHMSDEAQLQLGLY